MSQILMSVKELGRQLAREIVSCPAETKPGSLTYLLFGQQPSRQSICVKFGHVGEKLVQRMIQECPKIELLECGNHIMDDTGKKKDIDLLWADHKEKEIYYREAKGNIEMDTEKIPAMISKINTEIKKYLTDKWPDYKINLGILNWSVYDRKEITKGKSHIKRCEDAGIKVDHMKDILLQCDLVWPESDFYEYFSELGKILSAPSGATIPEEAQEPPQQLEAPQEEAPGHPPEPAQECAPPTPLTQLTM